MHTAKLLAFLLSAAPAAAAHPPDDDPSMRALVDELGRARTLKMDGADAPYFVDGYVNDAKMFDVEASFGAITHRGSSEFRTAGANVRVGSPELDNTSFADRDHFDMSMMMGDRGGAPVPVDGDYDALRQALWLRWDGAYKRALETLARKKAYLQTNASADRPNDFAPAKVVSLVQPKAKLGIDEERWTRVVREASAVFRAAPGVSMGNAMLFAQAKNETLATSDPIQVRFGENEVQLVLSASMAAPDGMELQLSHEVRGRVESDLPKDAEVLRSAKDLLAKLQALAKAPTLPEDYSGPVLFTGRAASAFFANALGDPLSGAREALGASSEGRLTERLGKHVTTPLLTVRDDSTQKMWKGKSLLGYYPVDDQGVKPEPITLIKKGVLQTYFTDRSPTRRVTEDNGHARGNRASMGTLFVEASETKSRDALKKQLIQLAKENDQDYGLLVEELDDGGMSRQFEFMDMDEGGGDIHLPPPAIAYRVFLDGHEELVRGASFKPVSFRALKDIAALGNEPTLLNTTMDRQSVSVIAPAVLVKQLDLKKPPHEHEKPPAISRPTVSAR